MQENSNNSNSASAEQQLPSSPKSKKPFNLEESPFSTKPSQKQRQAFEQISRLIGGLLFSTSFFPRIFSRIISNDYLQSLFFIFSRFRKK
jgi:hypothetical protein